MRTPSVPLLSAICVVFAHASIFTARAADTPTVILPVDSPAFVFSPGNWTGDAGRGGTRFRQTWNPGAYFRVTWETDSSTPTAALLLDTSTYPATFAPPRLCYSIDGVWHAGVPCASNVPIPELTGAGRHELTVWLSTSQQRERWGREGHSPLNVLRAVGLRVDARARSISATPRSKWALIVGDSITEGCGATELSGYAYLVARALQTLGFEYSLSACGWSGWINRGDNPPGDVPGYFVVRDAEDGSGGRYDDAHSRWNKIDGNGHSLLDAQGHISAYGETGQEPALILINYGTNDALHKSNPSDTQASIVQCLAALRNAAPAAKIVVLIPFGQYYARELKTAVALRKQQQPPDSSISIIDLGAPAARAIAKNGFLGGLHPNDRGSAFFAAETIPQLVTILTER